MENEPRCERVRKRALRDWARTSCRPRGTRDSPLLSSQHFRAFACRCSATGSWKVLGRPSPWNQFSRRLSKPLRTGIVSTEFRCDCWCGSALRRSRKPPADREPHTSNQVKPSQHQAGSDKRSALAVILAALEETGIEFDFRPNLAQEVILESIVPGIGSADDIVWAVGRATPNAPCASKWPKPFP